MYDGRVEKPVDIIAFDYDWWYELAKADGTLDDGQVAASLGREGCLYYARFRRAGETIEPTWVDSDGHQTCREAMQAAEQKVGSPISWQEIR